MSQENDFQEEQKETDRQRKKLEAALLILLFRDLQKRARQAQKVRNVLSEITQSVRDHTFIARRRGRELGILRLTASMRAIGVKGHLAGTGESSEQHDLDRSIGASRAIAETIIRRYRTQMRPGAGMDEALKRAVDETYPRAKVLIKTEVRSAFVEEREVVVTDILTRSQIELIQVWNISLCRGTCNMCFSLDGEERPMGVPFPYGPPLLHPNCGCYIDIVPARWAQSLAA